MPIGKENENPMFEFSTLRMIVGAFAFGLPWLVYILVGRATPSISASYHEVPTRDIFVGSLFVIGALLISYKGHLQGEPFEEGMGLLERFWSFKKWLHRYQENLISTLGGVAAVTAALFPTAEEPGNMDVIAYIHTLSAFLLFANVAYFSIIAFLRSLNKKLLSYEVFEKNEFQQIIKGIRTAKTQTTLNPLLFFWNFLTLEIAIFLAIGSEKLEQYKQRKTSMRFFRLLVLYGKKFTRGFVYVIFGSLTVLVLLVALILGLLVAFNVIQGSLLPPNTTFVIEALAMLFFGVTWITASQLEYGRPFEWLLERVRQKQPAVAQPGTP